ncbi:Hypothetical protein CINCED_3A006317 [Cinara cedri]|uniref:Uncharacterized protein n=1 Tax=Cinara cedri TaxID=506608 RepID=A0A5E4MIF2_9HEMI|nr:Hypothetical protein CINCED_3A006317 [Cinara cedri]
MDDLNKIAVILLCINALFGFCAEHNTIQHYCTAKRWSDCDYFKELDGRIWRIIRVKRIINETDTELNTAKRSTDTSKARAAEHDPKRLSSKEWFTTSRADRKNLTGNTKKSRNKTEKLTFSVKYRRRRCLSCVIVK